MKVLLVSTAHNSLSQRVQVELEARQHTVTTELCLSMDMVREAIDMFDPDIIVCPFLTKALPSDIYSKKVCLIVHPGILGDSGPSSLDWAMLNKETRWGVTVLQASDVMDGGDVWACPTFQMPSFGITKSSLYKQYIIPAAVEGVLEALDKFQNGLSPTPVSSFPKDQVTGIERHFMKQTVREINFSTMTASTILAKLRLSDTQPGILKEFLGKSFYFYGGCIETLIQGSLGEVRPGDLIAQRDDALCIACADNTAIWFSHLRQAKDPNVDKFAGVFPKLPAMLALRRAGVISEDLEPLRTTQPPARAILPPGESTFREVWYTMKGKTATLFWEFYNGAFSTRQCYLLRDEYVKLRSRDDVDVIVLAGGRDYFSNGIHLNMIETAPDPSEESWLNINAIDDFVKEVIHTTDKMTVTAFRGNAGAGGVIAGLASDLILGHKNVVLNPHYKAMGLFGSEYWTYLLPRRVGETEALSMTESMLPVSMHKAVLTRLVDEVYDGASIKDAVNYDADFLSWVHERISAFLTKTPLSELKTTKAVNRASDEAMKPLESYRTEELTKMRVNFAPGSTYNSMRRAFVQKLAPKETPLQFAVHRQTASFAKEQVKAIPETRITEYTCAYKA